MNKSLIKFASIFTAGLMVASSMSTFAATTIQSNVYNAVQTIMRTVFTSDGTASGTVLMDVNTGSRIFVNQAMLPIVTGSTAATGVNLVGRDQVTKKLVRPQMLQAPSCSDVGVQLSCALGLDDCPSVCYLDSSGENSTGADHDWYEVGTTTSPYNINDSKYTFGKVAIGTGNPGDSTLKVVGNIVFGDVNNRARYTADFSSVLGGLGNHVETIRSTIAGGYNNNIVADADHSFIGGGGYNTAHAWASVIGGGEYNTINNGYATAYATIAGGRNNSVMGEMSTIGGGGYHSVTNSFATIAGGYQNGVNGNFGTVGGGKNNVASAYGSTIAGGDMNSVTNLGASSSILGGVENRISNTNSAIAGGRQNIIHGAASFLGGGEQNIIEAGTMNVLGGGRFNTIKEGDWNTLVGGTKNFVMGFGLSLAGGEQNILVGSYSSLNGGRDNKVIGNFSAIAGGNLNVIAGSYSFIPGGELNIVNANNSFAGGKGAQALNNNTFVWNDGSQTKWSVDPVCQDPMAQLSCALGLPDCPQQCVLTAPFSSTQDSQFIVNATNGVGINTNVTTDALTVSGSIITSQTYKAPSGNAGISQTLNLSDNTGTPCTMTIEAGIVTSTTCP